MEMLKWSTSTSKVYLSTAGFQLLLLCVPAYLLIHYRIIYPLCFTTTFFAFVLLRWYFLSYFSFCSFRWISSFIHFSRDHFNSSAKYSSACQNWRENQWDHSFVYSCFFIPCVCRAYINTIDLLMKMYICYIQYNVIQPVPVKLIWFNPSWQPRATTHINNRPYETDLALSNEQW